MMLPKVRLLQFNILQKSLYDVTGLLCQLETTVENAKAERNLSFIDTNSVHESHSLLPRACHTGNSMIRL